MGRIAIAWELGGGSGHIQYDLPIAKKLKERDHEVICIMKHVIDADKILGQHGIQVLQAPVWQMKVKQLPNTYSYIETLFNHGYLVPGALLSMVKAWRSLFDLVRPDMVFLDHSPTALIALKGLSVKKILYGQGFFSPPKQSPMPSLIPWLKTPQGLLEHSEKKGLQVINSVLNNIGAPILEKLSDLFTVDEEILITFKEMDHYQSREQTKYWGAVINPPGGGFPSWPDVPFSSKIFCYLKSDYPGFENLLQILQQVEAAIIVYASGISNKQIQKFLAPNMLILQEPVDIHRACKESDMTVCHAGHGTVATSLLYGKPLVLLPGHNHLEQFLTARNVALLKAGIIITTRNLKDYKKVIESVLNEVQYKKNAQAFAEKYKDFDSESQLEEIVDRCEKILLEQ
jgi:UDP-N-acetylglucosamine:LPS N-acetylglucosamine transferase